MNILITPLLRHKVMSDYAKSINTHRQSIDSPAWYNMQAYCIVFEYLYSIIAISAIASIDHIATINPPSSEIHISAVYPMTLYFMFDHLHCLPLIARIQLKVLTLIYRSHGLLVKFPGMYMILSNENRCWLKIPLAAG